jgi:hypothetical protein
MIEIAYMEPNKNIRGDISEGIKNLFELLGEEARVRDVRTAAEVVADARNGRLDVFVCDLTLNTDEPLGLGVLSDVKLNCPGLFTIAVSGRTAELSEIDSQPGRFDLFIPKQSIMARAFDARPNYLARLKDGFRFSAVRSLPVQGAIVPITSVPPPENWEMLDLLRQIISYRLPMKKSGVISEIELKQLGGGRSSSYVFELIGSMGADRRPILPIVVKFSRLADSLEEIKRYDTYVKWTLPHQMRVDAVGVAFSETWGAVAYSFAHGASGLKTFREVLESGDVNRASLVLDKLFAGATSFWQSIKDDVPYANLTQRYFSRFYQRQTQWFNEDHTKIRTWARTSLPALQIGPNIWKLAGTEFPSWVRFLQGGMADKARDRVWSIVHGDLNPGNLIISGNDDVALIDFRDTGIGHCYEDAITLEVAFRANWPWPVRKYDVADVAALIATESNLSKEGVPLAAPDPGWELIQKLRNKTIEAFKSSLGPDYFYGLSYYCYRLLRVSSLDDGAKTRLIACGLCAAQESISRS